MKAFVVFHGYSVFFKTSKSHSPAVVSVFPQCTVFFSGSLRP